MQHRLSKIIQRHETKSISAIIHYHRTFEFERKGSLGIKIVNAFSKGKELLLCVIIGAFKTLISFFRKEKGFELYTDISLILNCIFLVKTEKINQKKKILISILKFVSSEKISRKHCCFQMTRFYLEIHVIQPSSKNWNKEETHVEKYLLSVIEPME